jgi:hypothetical protein
MPWPEPLEAVAQKMKWGTGKVAYAEYLMSRRIVVLKTVGLHKAAEQENKRQFWWERLSRPIIPCGPIRQKFP